MMPPPPALPESNRRTHSKWHDPCSDPTTAHPVNERASELAQPRCLRSYDRNLSPELPESNRRTHSKWHDPCSDPTTAHPVNERASELAQPRCLRSYDRNLS